MHTMQMNDPSSLNLEGFEGPLDFLLHLVQKKEIDIYEISLKEITEQFLKKLQEQLLNLDSGAKFVGITATLLWLKSKMLLPKEEKEDLTELEEDPNFAIIHQLIDYCRFKQTAQEWGEREQEQSLHYTKGVAPLEKKTKTLGIEQISLEELSALFQEVLSRMPEKKQLFKEKWHIADKVTLIRKHLEEASHFPLREFLFTTRCKEELIVTFLAVLELMKLSEICIIKEALVNGGQIEFSMILVAKQRIDNPR